MSKLLEGVAAFVRAPPPAAQAQDPAPAALHGSAACCLVELLQLLYWTRRGDPQASGRRGMLRCTLKATELSHLLINGRLPSHPLTCNCCLADSASDAASGSRVVPILSFSRAGQLMPTAHSDMVPLASGAVIQSVLSRLCSLRPAAQPGGIQAGGLLLELQSLALRVLQLRQLRAARAQPSGGGGGSSGGGSSGGGDGSNGSSGGGCSSRGSADAAPSCADLAMFIGQADAAAWPAPAAAWQAAPAKALVEQAALVVTALNAASEAVSGGACRRCSPQQLALVVDAVSLFPDQAMQPQQVAPLLRRVLSQLSAAWGVLSGNKQPAWRQAALRHIVPALSGWLLAAAKQLPTRGSSAPDAPSAEATIPGTAGGASNGGGASNQPAAALADAMLHAACLLVVGGALEPAQHRDSRPRRLLLCVESALRVPAAPGAWGRVSLGFSVVLVRLRCCVRPCPALPQPAGMPSCPAHPAGRFQPCAGPTSPIQVTHDRVPATAPVVQAIAASVQPSSFEQLWRCGALPGLVLTLRKLGEHAGPADSVSLAQAQVFDALLLRLLPPAAEGQRWCAGSLDRQQFILFWLAHVGAMMGVAAESILRESMLRRTAYTSLDGTPAGLLGMFATAEYAHAALTWGDALHRPARQLAQLPLLVQQLREAAPGLMPLIESLALLPEGMGRACELPTGLECSGRAAPAQDRDALQCMVQLLTALGRQLDPLALGLRLPGCWNPGCTSLAGASEAGMPMKLCAGCQIAR